MKLLCFLLISLRRSFLFLNALPLGYFGSTGRLHYFSAVYKVRAHASYMDVMYHMKALYSFLLLIAIGCSTNSELATFEHPLFKIEYPENWVTIEEPGMILAVAKYERELSTVKNENPNIIIVANDSLNFANEGVTNFEDFLTQLKQRTLLLENRKLLEDFKQLEINGNKVYRISFKVEGELKTLTQKQYFFSKNGFYVTVMGMYKFGGTGKEISAIMNSLELPDDEPIEKLLDLTDSI